MNPTDLTVAGDISIIPLASVENRRWHLDFERLLCGNFLVLEGKFFKLRI
jgi:hypothetical protein